MVSTSTSESAYCTYLRPEYGLVTDSEEILHEKRVIINGIHELTGLIDSGSSVCIMKESVGRRLGMSWTNNDSKIMGFGANAETIAIGKAVLNLQVN